MKKCSGESRIKKDMRENENYACFLMDFQLIGRTMKHKKSINIISSIAFCRYFS